MNVGTLTAAGFTLALAAALTLYLLFQRERPFLGWLVLALLCSILAWTTGLAIVELAAGDEDIERVGTRILYLGVMISPPLWLFLSARLARIAPLIEQRPVVSLSALLTPTAFLILGMWTDSRHGLFASGANGAQFVTPVSAWAGPLFWLHVAWSYACVASGIFCCALAAQRAASRLGRRRLLTVAAAAAIPLLSTCITLLEWLPADMKLTPLDLGVSSILLVTAVVRDRLLETSPLAAREVIAELKEGLILADEKTRVVDANSTALALLEIGLTELRGQTLVEVLARLDPAGRVDTTALCRAFGEDRTTNLRVGPGPDGRILEIGCSWVESPVGAKGFIAVFHDRTEIDQRERNRQRRQRLESLGVVAAGIAHEINNPLAYVRANLAHVIEIAELAKCNGPAMPAEIAEDWAHLPDVIREAQSGLEQIARIVDSTRRLSRDSSPAMQPLDLHRVLEDVLRIAGLGAPGVARLECELDPTLPQVQGAGESLAQILLNLLINARQAAGPDGLVRIETRATRDAVELSVSDDGPGIPEEALDRVFDPFFTTKGPEEGTGLGLAISHQIAQAHGGSLEVGDGPLGGACFRLRLPRAL